MIWKKHLMLGFLEGRYCIIGMIGYTQRLKHNDNNNNENKKTSKNE